METRSNLAQTLTDLANLYASPESVTRLRSKWPDLLPADPPPNVRYNVVYRSPSGQESSPNVPKEMQWIIWLRDLVRFMWVGSSQPVFERALEQILLTGSPAPKLPPWVQGLVPTPTPLSGVIGIDWKHRTFVYRPQTVLQSALYFLLQEANRTKVCANPDCQAPYFIAPRSNTRYCSSDCADAMQRMAKLDWWNKSGQQWREGRKPKSKRNRGK